MAEKTEKETLLDWSGREVGLVLGPGATLSSARYDRLNELIAETASVPPSASHLASASDALDTGLEPKVLKKIISDWVEENKPGRAIPALAKARWSAVLSLSQDSHFEREMSAQQRLSIVGKNVHEITTLDEPPPSRPIPVFKLLGSIQDDSHVYSEDSLEEHLVKLDVAIRAYTDLVHAAVICVGIGDFWSVAQKIFVTMRSSYASCPKSIVLLQKEVPKELARLERILARHATFYVIDATLGEVARYLSKPKRGVQQIIDYAISGEPFGALAQFYDIQETVNRVTSSETKKSQHHLLLDILCSPAKPLWDPFFS